MGHNLAIESDTFHRAEHHCHWLYDNPGCAAGTELRCAPLASYGALNRLKSRLCGLQFTILRTADSFPDLSMNESSPTLAVTHAKSCFHQYSNRRGTMSG